MRVMMKSAREAYDTAAKQHDKVLEHHIDHLTAIEETNNRARETHENAVAERKALIEQMSREIEETHARQMKTHQEHVEWWEHHQEEKKRLGVLEKVIGPFRYKLRGGENFRMMGVPGDPPKKQELPELPEIPDPEIVEPHDLPEFRHPKPEAYRAKKVDGEDYVEIDGVHGKALASPGSYILTAESDGHQIIVPESDFTRFYEKVV